MRTALPLRTLLVTMLVAWSHAAAAQQQQQQQQQPSRTGARRDGIDVVQYNFRVEFPDRAVPDTIRFTTTVVALRTAGVERLRLDLVQAMRVDSARVNGIRAPAIRAQDSLVVALPKGTGDTVVVDVYYRGLPTDGLIIRRDTTLGWTAFGDNFPDRARQWLAVVDHPSDKALVEWDVIAPATHRVIANGALVEETPIVSATAARRVRTRWRTARPIYTAVMVIGVAPFAVLELGETACGLSELPGCVRQSVWTSPAQRGAMPGHFSRAGDIVALFSRLVGPFPYEKLAHVSSSTRYGGMENAGNIFYSDKLFDNGGPSEGLIAHETAHQWFGDAVTEGEWPHVWLSEGFATYFSALWTEFAHGDSAFLRDMATMRRQVLASPITMTTPVINTELADLRQVLNTNVYQKAGFVLHMLRREIGDSAFFTGIRSYYAAHRHGNALTGDLQIEFERVAGRPLQWFFTQWMTRPGVANLQLTWQWDAERRRLIVRVVQSGAFPPYQLSLAVDVTDATGAVRRTRVVIPAQSKSVLEVPLSLTAAPRGVVFDADVSILGRVATP